MAETTSTQNVLTAQNAYVRLGVAGLGGVAFQILGSFVGTITFEASVNGQAFSALLVVPSGSTTAVTTATSTGLWTGSATGYLAVQARMSSYSSGAATVIIRSDAASPGGSGGGGGGGGGAVTIADGADVAEGTTTDPAATDSTSAWTVISLLKGIWNRVGSGGGGAVTIADGADVAEGATTDVAVTGDNAGTVSAKLRGINKILADVWNSGSHFLSVSIANATLAVTQSGSWVLSAGSALIGKVGIDQTTPGTTNGVQVNAALPAGNNNIGDVDVATLPALVAGTAIIGKVGIDQTTPGTTNGVQVNAALPAGTNNIGLVTPTYSKQTFGTAQTVINSATDIAASNFSGAPAATYDNTTDSLYPNTRYALAVCQLPDWAAAPVAGTTVDLYGVILDVDGTSDETDAPSGTASGGAHYFGSWTIAAADALQRRAIVIDLAGYSKIDFYIRNGTAQNMNNDGGTNATVKITPLAFN